MGSAGAAALAANEHAAARIAALEGEVPAPPEPPHSPSGGGDGGGNPFVNFFTHDIPATAGWAYNHGPHQVLNTLGYASNNLGEALQAGANAAMSAAGVLMVVGGAGGEGLGAVADATGVFVEVGIPLNVASAAVITAGVGVTGYYGSQAAQDFGKMYSEANSDGVIGESEGGPGEWVGKSRGGGSEDSWRYQEQISGKTRGPDGKIPEYEVNGVDFDGYRPDPNGGPGTLLEAKGKNATKFMTHEKLKHVSKQAPHLVKQARHQVEAAQGTPIEWHVAGRGAAQDIEKLLDAKGLAGKIEVIWTPAN
jgi:hypothetical protein